MSQEDESQIDIFLKEYESIKEPQEIATRSMNTHSPMKNRVLSPKLTPRKSNCENP